MPSKTPVRVWPRREGRTESPCPRRSKVIRLYFSSKIVSYGYQAERLPESPCTKSKVFRPGKKVFVRYAIPRSTKKPSCIAPFYPLRKTIDFGACCDIIEGNPVLYSFSSKRRQRCCFGSRRRASGSCCGCCRHSLHIATGC